MKSRIRLAVPEEVESIRATSDLDSTCVVLALETAQGIGLAVIRQAVELDPIYFPPEWNTKQKTFFVRDIETVMQAKGAVTYYFNVDATNEVWIENLKNWGAEQVSPTPELRFKVTL
jgi:hypothetical protein